MHQTAHQVKCFNLSGWASVLMLCAFAQSAQAQRERFPTMVGPGVPYSGAPAPYRGSPPSANLNGTIRGPSSSVPIWDPYANPLNRPPLPPPGPVASPYPPATFPPQGAAIAPGGNTPAAQRLIQDLTLRNTWINGSGTNELGIDVVDIHATFIYPFWYNQPPLKITPGLSVYFWNGPISTISGSPDLPGETYDAYVDFSWEPTITERFGAILSLQPGAFTDFNNVSTNSFRFKGRGLAVFSYSPNLEILAGVEYLNRDDIKILPAGGVIWTPTPDVRYEILFPYPKLARRLKTIGTTDWWGYVAGEYGGGAWKISRANGTGDSADYGDLRLIFGLEWQGLSEINGYFEVGYVFERKLQYTSGTPSFRPNDAVMLRAGLNY